MAELFLLSRKYEQRRERRGWDESIAGLKELSDHVYVGPAAQTGLRCVEERGADPRLMLLVCEAALEGYFSPRTKQQQDWERDQRRRGA